MRITQILLISVLVYLPIISQIFGLGLKTFMKDSNFNGMRCSTNVSFEKAQVNNEVKCAAACMREDNCVSVFYSGTTNLCVGCLSTMTSNSDSVPMMGSHYYHRTGQEYMGCYTDNNPNRAMGNYEIRTPSMTIEMCSDICTEKETVYFAVQAGMECFCGDTYDRYGPSTNCTGPCVGDQEQICGGILALSVYKLG